MSRQKISKEDYEFLESKLRKEGFRNFQVALEIEKLFKKYAQTI